MNPQRWKQQLSEMETILKKAGIQGCYAGPMGKSAQGYIGLGRAHCRGCWEIIPETFLFKNFRYCKKCMDTRNNIEDYQMIFRDVYGLMENFMQLKNHYRIRMGWNQTAVGREPARVIRGGWGRNYILGRIRVRRDAIPKHLAYSYVELWMGETDQNGRVYQKLCVDFLKKEGIRGDARIIACWYMIQYMYAKGEISNAGRGRALIKMKLGEGLEELIKKYPLWEPGNQNDDRVDLGKMLCDHPVMHIV